MAFLVILPVALLCTVVFDKRIEETIGLSMIWAALLTYICGIVYRLDVAPILVAAAAAISLVAAIIIAVKKKKFPKVITIGLLEYFVLSAYYMLVMRNRLITGQDGLRVYERYVADFYHVGDICRYRNPVGLMMWKYLSLKFWPNYSEGIQLLGPVVMCVAFLLFILSFEGTSKKETIIKSLIGLFFVIIIPVNFRLNSGYFVMQYDFVSGMLTAYILCAYKKLLRKDDLYYKLLIVSGLAFLVHIKTNGIILAAICVLIIAGMEMTASEKNILKRHAFAITSGIGVVISKLSWTFFCKLHDAEEKFSISDAFKKMNFVMVGAMILAFIIVATVFFYLIYKKNFKLYYALILLLAAAIFAGTQFLIPRDIKLNTAISFLKVLTSNYAVDREFGLGSTFLMPFIIAIVSLHCFYLILAGEQADLEIEKKNSTFILLTHAGFALYSSVVYLTNYYARSVNQTAKAKECERYIFVYILVYILIYLYLFISEYDKTKNYKYIITVLLVSGLFMTRTHSLYSQLVNRPEFYTFDGLNYINISADDKFYFVDARKESDCDQFYFRSSPAGKVPWDYMDMYLSEEGMDEPVSYDEWVNLLSECTYVYLATSTDEFIDVYGDVFADEIVDGRIYRVITDESGVKLKSIEY